MTDDSTDEDCAPQWHKDRARAVRINQAEARIAQAAKEDEDLQAALILMEMRYGPGSVSEKKVNDYLAAKAAISAEADRALEAAKSVEISTSAHRAAEVDHDLEAAVILLEMRYEPGCLSEKDVINYLASKNKGEQTQQGCDTPQRGMGGSHNDDDHDNDTVGVGGQDTKALKAKKNKKPNKKKKKSKKNKGNKSTDSETPGYDGVGSNDADDMDDDDDIHTNADLGMDLTVNTNTNAITSSRLADTASTTITHVQDELPVSPASDQEAVSEAAAGIVSANTTTQQETASSIPDEAFTLEPDLATILREAVAEAIQEAVADALTEEEVPEATNTSTTTQEDPPSPPTEEAPEEVIEEIPRPTIPVRQINTLIIDPMILNSPYYRSWFAHIRAHNLPPRLPPPMAFQRNNFTTTRAEIRNSRYLVISFPWPPPWVPQYDFERSVAQQQVARLDVDDEDVVALGLGIALQPVEEVESVNPLPYPVSGPRPGSMFTAPLRIEGDVDMRVDRVDLAPPVVKGTCGGYVGAPVVGNAGVGTTPVDIGTTGGDPADAGTTIGTVVDTTDDPAGATLDGSRDPTRGPGPVRGTPLGVGVIVVGGQLLVRRARILTPLTTTLSALSNSNATVAPQATAQAELERLVQGDIRRQALPEPTLDSPQDAFGGALMPVSCKNGLLILKRKKDPVGSGL